MKPKLILCGIVLSVTMPVLAQQPDAIRLVTAASDIIPGEIIRVELGGNAGARETANTRVMVDGQLAPAIASRTPGVLNVVVPAELYEGRAEVKVVRSGRDGMTDVPIFTRTVNVSMSVDKTIASSTFKILRRGGSAGLSRSLSVEFVPDAARGQFSIEIDKIESERYRRMLALDRQLSLHEVSRIAYRIATEGGFLGDATVRISLPDDLVSAHAAGETVEAYKSESACNEFRPLDSRFDAATNELVLSLSFSRLRPLGDECQDETSVGASSIEPRGERSIRIALAVR